MANIYDEEEYPADYHDFELDNRPRNAIEDVPWDRCGIPGQSSSGLMSSARWGPYQVNSGCDRHRLYSDESLVEFATNAGHFGRVGLTSAEERSFAELWDYENNGANQSVLSALLSTENMTESESKAAELATATVVQWLGTPLGRNFVDHARANARLLVDRLQKEIDRDLLLQASIGIEGAERTVRRKSLTSGDKEESAGE